jgi:hypothetical protein
MKPLWHAQVPLPASQSPLPEQFSGQWIELQSKPVKPSLQLHAPVFSSQVPWP